MNHSEFLSKIHRPVNSSWNNFLSDDNKVLLKTISSQFQKTNHTPSPERVLHFLTVDLSKAKIIILGQDPYPQKGVATGRAFEVSSLRNWDQPFRNVSLKNIVRSIYFSKTNEYLTYKQIISQYNGDLFSNRFEIAPPNVLFKKWEKQGVLLLNTSFTCTIGQPGSHSSAWAPFTTKLLNYINEFNPKLKWFLWGKHAQNAVSNLSLLHKYESNHPMICQPGESDFLYGKVNCFRNTENEIDWTGLI